MTTLTIAVTYMNCLAFAFRFDIYVAYRENIITKFSFNLNDFVCFAKIKTKQINDIRNCHKPSHSHRCFN